jgi:acyl dehydratase
MTAPDAEPTPAAPKTWRGRLFEDLEPGDVFRSRLGRTVTDTDNAWFTMLTLNTNQLHFNAAYAERTRWGRQLVNSCLTLSIVSGLSVADTSENTIANLSWTDIRLPKPVFAGDTLWAESEVLETRASRSDPTIGIVSIRTRGLNQNGEVVIEFLRAFMLPRRTAVGEPFFPKTQDAWTVGRDLADDAVDRVDEPR